MGCIMRTFFSKPGVRRGLHAACWLAPCLLYCYAVALAPHARGADLYDQPDPQEYALLAGRLASLEQPLISIGLHDYPSRYSLAYPALLAPFAGLFGHDLTRLHWAPMLFGLIAVGMLARVGSWMLGSRLAGGLAAAIFALHPAVVAWAVVVMSETGLVMMFLLMLEAGRPWLAPTPGRLRVSSARAALLGLLLGWLTLCKAPFAWWALAMTALATAHAFEEKRWRPLAALIGGGLACAVGELAYRRWAFGSWLGDGYDYWHPSFYAEFFRVFNVRYLFEPVDAYFQTGAARCYGRMLLGRAPDYYAGPLAAIIMLIAAPAALWPGRRGRPGWAAIALMAGWLAVGGLFCGLYFFQSNRFLLLWIPTLDLLIAWALARLACWSPLRRGWTGRRRLHRVGFALAILASASLLYGEFQNVRAFYHHSPGRQAKPLLPTIKPLLAQVPEGAWLLTNYNLPVVQRLRPSSGPTAALYSDERDAPVMNCHIFAIWRFQLEPFRPGANSLQQPIPCPSWKTGPSVLIDPAGSFRLNAAERRTLFSKPVYLLLVTPDFSPATAAYFRDKIRPMLEQDFVLEPVQTSDGAALYRCGLKSQATRDAHAMDKFNRQKEYRSFPTRKLFRPPMHWRLDSKPWNSYSCFKE